MHKHKIKGIFARGHNEHVENERCDILAHSKVENKRVTRRKVK